jgi:hypothetical protein
MLLPLLEETKYYFQTNSHKNSLHLNPSHHDFLATILNMKLPLLLLVSMLFHLSNGFMAELTGKLSNETTCTGNEFADFKQCAKQGATSDPNLPEEYEIEEKAYVTQYGSGRQLGVCGGCPLVAPRGTFCYTWCGRGSARRLLEDESTDTPSSRRLNDNVAVYNQGVYTGGVEAVAIAEVIIGCFQNVSSSHPCLGSTADMTLTVHTTLTSAEDLIHSSAGCIRGGRRL